MLIGVALLVPACGVGGGGTLTPTVAPGIPSQVSAIGGNGQVTISWVSAGAPVTYTVLRSQTSGGPYLTAPVPAQFLTPSSYRDTGLQNGKTYYYVVTASNPFGTSPSSVEVKGTPRFAARSIAPGSMASHTLALFEDGSVWGWGLNNNGEVGNGVQNYQSSPAQALGLSNVTALARGYEFSFALDGSGHVWSWGINTSRQLGVPTDSAAFSLTPLPVTGLPTITAIAAGYTHALALATDGTVWAWGDDAYGELGNGFVSIPSAAPTKVSGVSGIIALSAGFHTSLALAGDGTVWAWGLNSNGTIGTGSSGAPVTSPSQVKNLNGVTQIVAGGQHCLALRNDGTVWAWGDNSWGQVGMGVVPPLTVPTPTQVISLTDVQSIAAGNNHSLASKTDGSVWSWGNDASTGTLGSGSLGGIRMSPGPVVNLTGVASVAAGYFHSVALQTDGSVWMWGENILGELGIGAGNEESVATEVNSLTAVTAVAGGFGHSVGLRSDGTVWAWGEAQGGELGNNTTFPAQTSTPVPVDTLTGITAIAAGSAHSLARKSDGTVWAWGVNTSGQIGNGGVVSPVISPVQVPLAGATFTAVAGGGAHSLAIRNDVSPNLGTVWAWGLNNTGQIGNGTFSTTTPVTSPSSVIGLSGITAIAAGYNHSLALKSDGSVWAWGLNSSGQIGNGTVSGTPVTTPVSVLTGMAAIAAGTFHSLAVGQDGSVWSWGSNSYGELGQGILGTSSGTPAQVPGISGVVAVSAGQYFSVALSKGGTASSWGINQSAQLGDGTTNSHMVPSSVVSLSGITAIASGSSHSLAVQTGGLAWAWGLNISDQLGTPLVSSSPVPVEITH